MGWWESSNGDILGDGPADVFLDALRGLAEPPPLAELLDGLHACLASVGRDLVADPETLEAFRLRARLPSPHGDIVTEGSATAAVTDALSTFLFDAQEEYDLGLDRRPTARELVRTAAFCLRGQSDRFLRGSPTQLLELILEPMPSPEPEGGVPP